MKSTIPRYTFNELPTAVADALLPKYQRLGYLGEFFAATAHQPEALKAFIDFTDLSKGELDMRLVELIALTVATMKHVNYEKNQHERLSVRLGYGHDWVAAVEALAPDRQACLTEDERCVQRYVMAAVPHDGANSAAQLNEVSAHLGPKQAVAVLFVVGRYVAHAVMVNSLGIAAPVSSIFDPAFVA